MRVPTSKILKYLKSNGPTFFYYRMCCFWEIKKGKWPKCEDENEGGTGNPKKGNGQKWEGGNPGYVVVQ